MVRSGDETAIADSLRMVEEAQTKETRVQRLADDVSGKFVWGVMAASAATFTFWNTVSPFACAPAIFAIPGLVINILLASSLKGASNHVASVFLYSFSIEGAAWKWCL